MWNLVKWNRWSYLESTNGDINVENIHMGTEGEWGWMGWIGRFALMWICVYTHTHTYIYTIDTMHKIDRQWQPSV